MIKKACFLALLALPVFAQNPIHVTYLWHMHQPNYYPYNSVDDIDSWGLFNFNIRNEVFNPRTGPYGEWVKNAVQASHDRNMPHAGVQVSFSGSLMENMDGLYGHGWREHYRWARNGLRTSLGNPRLDIVGFSHHHSLMPLTSRESMIMQVRLHREAYKDVWNAQDDSYSKGFFPSESSFSMHMIPALADQGIEWVLVDSGHIDRTLEDLPWSAASSIRPNRADQRNGVAADWNSQWTQLQNVWAPTPVAAPFSYQPHRMRYVDPNSDPNNPTVYRMIAVPAARYEGNENARGGYGAFKPENVWGSQVDRNNNADRPMLIVCHSDGDNFGMLNADAYHGQHQMFLDMTINNQNFAHTSIQDYLDMYPVPENSPYIHAEPGSWIGIDGGTPYYEKWVEDNAVDGEHPDHWNWSVLQAAHNRVVHAESLENNYSMNDVRWGIGSDTAKAWRNYLNAETSCYWYWDFDRANPWDGNVTRAANMAIEHANKVIARHPGVDTVGPSIFHPQRRTWNPGGNHWGEGDNNMIQPSDFEVWTFVDDVSGVASVELKWRTADWDSFKNLNEYRHEVYAHTPGLNSPWKSVQMTSDWYPPVKGPLVPDPLNRAMRYTGHVTGESDTLVSYYVEATDTVGNVSRSEIFHVWVGETTDGGGPGPRVEFDPPAPDGCVPVTIRYPKSGTMLGGGQVYIHIGRNGWQDTIEPSPAMTDAGDYWEYVYETLEDTYEINIVFNDGDGTWDNNSGRDWRLSVANCGDGGITPPPPGDVVETVPAAPQGCDPITIRYNPTGRNLAAASQVYIHIGRNGWQDVLADPNPGMTRDGAVWTYTYHPDPGTEVINFVFNNGAETWDNNDDRNWNVMVADCEGEPPLPSALVITDPASDTAVSLATSTYTLAGTASGIVGDILWDNVATGASGTIPAGASWSLPNVELAVGANLITLTAAVGGSGDEGTVAEDQAGNYDGVWTQDSNQGTGFAPWQLGGFGEHAGHFIEDSVFGLWSHEGDNLAEAVRPFAAPLGVGDTFRVRIRNGWVWENGGSVGAALRDEEGNPIWQLFFNGGNQFYDGTDGMTQIGWTDAGIDLAFTLTSPSSYSVVLHPVGGSPLTYVGNFEGEIHQFRAWSYNNGTDDGDNPNRNFFFNHLSIATPGVPGMISTSVTITRDSDGGPSPQLSITQPASDISVMASVDNYTLAGAALGLSGDLAWFNALTGDSGSIPATEAWQIEHVPLAIGANVITVSSGAGMIAADTASNYEGWADGSNEGTGFAPWTLHGVEGEAGTFADAEQGFGLWSHEGGNLAEALRDFSSPLAVGDSFHVRIRNGWVWEEGGSIGVALRDGEGNTVWQLYFNGGNEFYAGTDGDTDMGWTDAGINIAFTLTGPETYSVTLHPDGSSARTYTGMFAGSIESFRAWSYNNGTDDGDNHNRNFYFDNVQVSSTTASATVTITRLGEDDGEDSNADGVPDSWYQQYNQFLPANADMADPNIGRAMGANGNSLRCSYMLGLDPTDPDSTFAMDAFGLHEGQLRMHWGGGENHSYVIEHKGELSEDEWSIVGERTLPVNGGSRSTTYSDLPMNGNSGFYRIRFQP